MDRVGHGNSLKPTSAEGLLQGIRDLLQVTDNWSDTVRREVSESQRERERRFGALQCHRAEYPSQG